MDRPRATLSPRWYRDLEPLPQTVREMGEQPEVLELVIGSLPVDAILSFYEDHSLMLEQPSFLARLSTKWGFPVFKTFAEFLRAYDETYATLRAFEYPNPLSSEVLLYRAIDHNNLHSIIKALDLLFDAVSKGYTVQSYVIQAQPPLPEGYTVGPKSFAAILNQAIRMLLEEPSREQDALFVLKQFYERIPSDGVINFKLPLIDAIVAKAEEHEEDYENLLDLLTFLVDRPNVLGYILRVAAAAIRTAERIKPKLVDEVIETLKKLPKNDRTVFHLAKLHDDLKAGSIAIRKLQEAFPEIKRKITRHRTWTF